MMNLRLLCFFLMAISAMSHEWLNQKAQDDGVAPLGQEGVLYEKKYEGHGVFYPLHNATVILHYKIISMNNTLLYETENPMDMIWNELPMNLLKLAIAQMVEADEFELYVPATLQADLGPLHQGLLPPDDPFMMRIKFLQLIDDDDNSVKKYALTCVLATKQGCNDEELNFCRNFYAGTRGHAEHIRGEGLRLIKFFSDAALDTPADYNWYERRIFLMPQLADMEEERAKTSVAHWLELERLAEEQAEEQNQQSEEL
jgi:hypothetical protein